MSSVRDRRKALELLAGSLWDFMPGPSTWTANPLSSRSEPGRPAPSKKEPCAAKGCDHGKVKDKFGRDETCKDCDGRGFHWEDAYTGKAVSTLDAPAPSQTRRVMCDRCAGFGVWKQERCELCDGAGKVSVPIVRDLGRDPEAASDGLGPWDRAIDRRNKAGSYHELDLALSKLSRTRRRLFHLVYVSKSAGVLSETEFLEVERAVVELLGWMPVEIVVPRDVVAADRRKPLAPRGYEVRKEQRDGRDAVWKARYKAGETSAAIALSDGVDRSTVDRGIRRAA